MHELSVVIEILDVLEEIKDEQGLEKIKSVSVEAGELCGIIPDYFKECWNAARIGSVFENTELKLEVLPAVARCVCGREFEFNKNGRVCPFCGKSSYALTSGREFQIKEITAK